MTIHLIRTLPEPQSTCPGYFGPYGIYLSCFYSGSQILNGRCRSAWGLFHFTSFTHERRFVRNNSTYFQKHFERIRANCVLFFCCFDAAKLSRYFHRKAKSSDKIFQSIDYTGTSCPSMSSTVPFTFSGVIGRFQYRKETKVDESVIWFHEHFSVRAMCCEARLPTS